MGFLMSASQPFKCRICLISVLSSNHGRSLIRVSSMVAPMGLTAHLTPLPDGESHHRVTTVSTQPLDEGAGGGRCGPGPSLPRTLCLL